MLVTKTLLRGLLLAVGVLAAGCGASGDDPMDVEENFHPTAEMVGTWIFESVTVDGAPASLADVLEWLPNAVESRLHIQASGAYVYEEVNSAGGQLWFESGFVLVNTENGEFELNSQLDSDGPNTDIVLLTYTLVSGVLTLEIEEFGVVTVFTLRM